MKNHFWDAKKKKRQTHHDALSVIDPRLEIGFCETDCVQGFSF